MSKLPAAIVGLLALAACNGGDSKKITEVDDSVFEEATADFSQTFTDEELDEAAYRAMSTADPSAPEAPADEAQ